MIPNNFEEWKSCIVNDCNIDLTKNFVQSRLVVYENRNSIETKKFIALYAEVYLEYDLLVEENINLLKPLI